MKWSGVSTLSPTKTVFANGIPGFINKYFYSKFRCSSAKYLKGTTYWVAVEDSAGQYLTIQDVVSETILTEVISLHYSATWSGLDATNSAIFTSG